MLTQGPNGQSQRQHKYKKLTSTKQDKEQSQGKKWKADWNIYNSFNSKWKLCWKKEKKIMHDDNEYSMPYCKDM
jgi:hypothetical protein